eukprot:760341-Hanusia_phi.AAC.1
MNRRTRVQDSKELEHEAEASDSGDPRESDFSQENFQGEDHSVGQMEEDAEVFRLDDDGSLEGSQSSSVDSEWQRLREEAARQPRPSAPLKGRRDGRAEREDGNREQMKFVEDGVGVVNDFAEFDGIGTPRKKQGMIERMRFGDDDDDDDDDDEYEQIFYDEDEFDEYNEDFVAENEQQEEENAAEKEDKEPADQRVTQAQEMPRLPVQNKDCSREDPAVAGRTVDHTGEGGGEMSERTKHAVEEYVSGFSKMILEGVLEQLSKDDIVQDDRRTSKRLGEASRRWTSYSIRSAQPARAQTSMGDTDGRQADGGGQMERSSRTDVSHKPAWNSDVKLSRQRFLFIAPRAPGHRHPLDISGKRKSEFSKILSKPRQEVSSKKEAEPFDRKKSKAAKAKEYWETQIYANNSTRTFSSTEVFPSNSDQHLLKPFSRSKSAMPRGGTPGPAYYTLPNIQTQKGGKFSKGERQNDFMRSRAMTPGKSLLPPEVACSCDRCAAGPGAYFKDDIRSLQRTPAGLVWLFPSWNDGCWQCSTTLKLSSGLLQEDRSAVTRLCTTLAKTSDRPSAMT